MSSRKQRFVGELSTEQIIRNILIGGLLLGILLGVWFGYPAVLNQLSTAFGGTQYDPHVELPTETENYELVALTWDVELLIDPQRFPDVPPEVIDNFFNGDDDDAGNEMSDFNETNWNVPIFNYTDIGYDPAGGGMYHPFMRQNCYDILSDLGNQWERSTESYLQIGEQTIVGWRDQGKRRIFISLGEIGNMSIRLPFFSYQPKYVDSSLSIQRENGTFEYAQDRIILSKSQSTDVIKADNQDPSLTGNGTLRYDVVHDAQIRIQDEETFKAQSLPPQNNIPFGLFNYLQVPGNDWANYMQTHYYFNLTYNNIKDGYHLDPAINSATEILNATYEYLTYHYKQFELYPERPGDNDDMIEWFLTRSIENGYDGVNNSEGGTTFDFASAFVMLARAFGIPARLVTGWNDTNGDGVMQLFEQYSWAEAYLPNSSNTGNFVIYDFPKEFNQSAYQEMQQDLDQANLNNSTIIIENPEPNEYFLYNETDVDINFNFSISTPMQRSNIYHVEFHDQVDDRLVTSVQITNPSTFNITGTRSISDVGDYYILIWTQISSYDTGIIYNLTSEHREFSIGWNETISVSTPETIYNRTTNIPLILNVSPSFNTSMYNYILELDYSTNLTIDDNTSYTFNLSNPANGPHYIKGYMTRKSDNQTRAESQVWSFYVLQENFSINIIQPANGSVINSTDYAILQYIVVNNASNIIEANYSYYYVSNGSRATPDQSLPLTGAYGPAQTVSVPNFPGQSMLFNLTIKIKTAGGFVQNSTIINFTRTDSVNILTPSPSGTDMFYSNINIPLNFTYLNYSSPIKNLTYVVDSTTNVTFWNGTGPILNTTFNTSAINGLHTVQIIMWLTDGRMIGSQNVTFTLSAEFGKIIIYQPSNGTVVYDSNTTTLQYDIVNRSGTIQSAVYAFYYLNGTMATTNQSLPVADSFGPATTIDVYVPNNASVTYLLKVTIITGNGMMENSSIVTFYPPDTLEILIPDPSNTQEFYSNVNIPLNFTYFNSSSNIDNFTYIVDGSNYTTFWSGTGPISNTTFNISSTPGVHNIQLIMGLVDGRNVTSALRSFYFYQETGSVIINQPIQDSTYFGQDSVPLSYTVINNIKPISKAEYLIENASNPTNNTGWISLPLSTSYSGFTVSLWVPSGKGSTFNLIVNITTEWGSFQNSTNFTMFPAERISIDNPVDSAFYNYSTNIPLDITVENYTTVIQVAYSLDGGAKIDITSQLIVSSPYSYINMSFNVGASGNHAIQAFLQTTQGNTSSTIITFNISLETGGFESFALPVNNSYKHDNAFPIDYEIRNDSNVVDAFYKIYYAANGSLATGPVSLPLATAYSGTITVPVNDFQVYQIVVYIQTEWGVFNSNDTFGQINFEYRRRDTIQIIDPRPTTIIPFYNNRSNIPITFFAYASDGYDQFQYVLNGSVFAVPGNTNGTISVPSNGYYDIMVRGNLTVNGSWVESDHVLFRVIQEEGVVNIELPVNGTTINNTVVNTNSSPIYLYVLNSTPIQSLYCIINPGNINITISLASFPASVNSSNTGVLANNNYTIQAFMRTDASYPAFISSPLTYFEVDYENGSVIIDQPLYSDSDSHPNKQLSQSNIPLNYTISTSGTVQSREFRVDGGSWSPIPGNITFNVFSNGLHNVSVRVTTDRGVIYSAVRAFYVNQTDYCNAYANDLPVLYNAIPDSGVLVLKAHLHDSLLNPLSGINVSFYDVLYNSTLLGSNTSDGSGIAYLFLNATTLQTLKTGVHKILVQTSTSLTNYTYFAISRSINVLITSLSPINGTQHYFIRSNSNQGTTFTLKGKVLDAVADQVPYAELKVNLDNNDNCDGLNYTSNQYVLSNATGDFTWIGQIDISTSIGLHDLNVTFTGKFWLDSYNFTGFVMNSNWTAINVTAKTSLTVDFSPKLVELGQNITISGYLRLDNNTGFDSQVVNITIEYLNNLGQVIQTNSTSAITDGTGYYSTDWLVIVPSTTIRITANYYPVSPLYLSSSSVVEG
ncbi:MAG: transglutaminase-like domain-containing protein [Promethearchaeota archaeon]